MKKCFYVLLISSLLLSTSNAQNTPEDLPQLPSISGISELMNSFEQIQKLNLQNHVSKDGIDELIIGDDNPDETLTITGNYLLVGNLTIINNGKVILDHANFQIDGDINVFGTGSLQATGGNFDVIQQFTYEHKILIGESGLFSLDSVQFHSSEQSWSVTAIDSGLYKMTNSTVSNGFITAGFFGDASALIINDQLPGEFLCFGNNDIQFRNNDWLLFWLVLFDSSTVDVELPGDSLLTGWQFNENQPNVSGISYSVSIDSCTNVNWGLISQSGSDATFHNTNFRTNGIMFNDPDSIVVQNLVNNSHYTDNVIDVSDRNLHLINTDVQTWNFYPFEQSKVTVRNSIFGELITSDSAFAMIDNSVCDGSGGHLEASSHSTLLVLRSIINSQVLCRDFAILAGINSAFMGTEIVSNDFSVIAMLNTQFITTPVPNQSSVIFNEQLPSVDGFAGSLVGIQGTAQLFSGPESTVQFNGYKVFFSPNPAQPEWMETDGLHNQQVLDDTLAVWNAENLPVGNYPLALSVYHTLGDSISVMSSARLEVNTAVDNEKNIVKQFKLEQNYPNPFNPSTVIRYEIPDQVRSESNLVTLKVYDLLGKEVAALVNEEKPAGYYKVKFDGSDLASGMYIYRLTAGKFSSVRKMLLLK